MALTQIQTIQSLGESLSWLEREIGWGTPLGELTHLTGRIGELYSALISNGQMASRVNQRGYDVVGEDGERISVKTTTRQKAGGSMRFNPNTLDQVDRIMILRINTEEMEIQLLFDGSKREALEIMRPNGDKYDFPLRRIQQVEPDREILILRETKYKNYVIQEAESGSIYITKNSKHVSPVRPLVRKIASEIGVDVMNANGNFKNTRQLGAQVAKAIREMAS